MFHFIELTMPRTTKNGEIWFLRNPGQLALQLLRGSSTGCSHAHCSSQHPLMLNFGFLLPCDRWKVLQWQALKWDAHDVVHSGFESDYIFATFCVISHTFVSLCVTYNLILKIRAFAFQVNFHLSNCICMSWDLISLISTLASWICRHI